MSNVRYIILEEYNVDPVIQSDSIDISWYAANSVADIEVHILMHSDNELLFMRKIYWKGNCYVLIDSERDEFLDVIYEAGTHMSISDTMVDAVAKDQILQFQQYAYEIELTPGRYIGFEHLIFETGLQVIQYDVRTDYIDGNSEPEVIEFIRVAYDLPEEILSFDGGNWMLLNEWIKKYEM